MKDGAFVGSLDDVHTYQSLVDNPHLIDTPISGIMQKAFPVVKENTTIEGVSKLINKETAAVLVELMSGKFHIVSRQDIISSLS